MILILIQNDFLLLIDGYIIIIITYLELWIIEHTLPILV